jgi:ribonuclease P protein component
MKKSAICRLYPRSTRLSTGVEDVTSVILMGNDGSRGAAVSGIMTYSPTVENVAAGGSSILPARPAPVPFRERRRRETNLSTQRPAPEAATRVPSEDVVARGPSDTEAASRERAQAPLRLSRPPVQRRNRLSRSRDFDTVYRRGKSTSTRHLVLHWFPREENGVSAPRLGLAVPRSVGSAVVRNRVKRLLREAWRELLESVPPGHDYVLAARPGFAEPAEARGREWLVSEIAGALERVRP